MERPLTILLVEDEPAECREIIEYIESIEDTTLIGVTNSSAKAIELVKDYRPDAVILDLELHKGSGTGLGFLSEMRGVPGMVFPYVLVTTNNVSTVTHDKARQLGADFIIVKSQSDYCAGLVVEFLRALRNTIQSNKRLKERQNAVYEGEPPEILNKRIITRITFELDRIGISPKAKGRKYLSDAIVLLIGGFQGSVYPEIAKAYQKNDASVERAMQNAINNAWRTADIEDLQRHYSARISSHKGVPTVTEFIYYYATKIKNEY